MKNINIFVLENKLLQNNNKNRIDEKKKTVFHRFFVNFPEN